MTLHEGSPGESILGRSSVGQSAAVVLPRDGVRIRSFGLDLARAAAIVLVLVSHGLGFWAPLVGDSLVNPIGVFWVTGIDGVELFFCLSGFLIGGLLLDIQRRNPSFQAVRIFLVRRWMRTLPLYYLTLVAFVLFPQIEPNARENIWSYFLLVQNLVTPMPAAGWFGTSWSLTIEEWSYLALPLLAFYACRRNRHPVRDAALILIAIGFAVRLGIGLIHGVPDLVNWDRLIRKLVLSRSDAVAFGVLAAVFAERLGGAIRLKLLPVAAALLGLNIWLCYHWERIPGIAGWLLFFPLAAVGFSLLLPWLAELPTPRAFVTPIRFLARISYALYLVHWAFMYTAMTVPAPYQLIVYFAGSLLVATLLSYAIEYPIMRLRPRQV
jgi:peptidoglycan/LPS O-acetylase OafA/YrhL